MFEYIICGDYIKSYSVALSRLTTNGTTVNKLRNYPSPY